MQTELAVRNHAISFICALPLSRIVQINRQKRKWTAIPPLLPRLWTFFSTSRAHVIMCCDIARTIDVPHDSTCIFRHLFERRLFRRRKLSATHHCTYCVAYFDICAKQNRTATSIVIRWKGERPMLVVLLGVDSADVCMTGRWPFHRLVVAFAKLSRQCY